jgi:dihydroorotate dehydrogenase
MMKFLYQNALKPILFQFDPEVVHDTFVKIGSFISGKPPLIKLISIVYGPPKRSPVIVDGVTYQGPLLLSAGFDYNAYLSDILYYIGLAGEEVGSVTARPCPGNPRPRLKRLIKSRSIQVYKGLRNDGVDEVIKRIKTKKIPPEFVLGISIAKTNDEKCADTQSGIDDYCYSLRRLVEEKIGDFYTINISCPNAFGGEDFATPDRLELLLSALGKIKHQRPMYIKMPINLSWEKFRPLLDVIKKHEFQGVVIGNLNKDYKDLDYPEEAPAHFRGGLSGRPCRELSNNLIKLTREYFPVNFTIIGAGGILSVKDAQEKINLGANLIQMISGMIFTGPQLINEINESIKSQ